MTRPPDEAAGVTGTSRRIRGAMSGDSGDLEWMITRLSPILVQQARYRMRDRLRRVCDPEDVVAYAWQVMLPRIGDLTARDGRYTPVLLRFLSRTIVFRVNELLRNEMRRPVVDVPPASGTRDDGPADAAPGVWSCVVRRERDSLVARAIAALEADDQTIIILRLVEQAPAKDVGARLGLLPGTVNVRLHRALARLRDQLRGSIFDDLSAEFSLGGEDEP